MPIYLVRLHQNREAVGIFAIEEVSRLYDYVEEVTDPALCEYAEIGSGSILWERGGANPFPLSADALEGMESSILELIGPTTLGETWLHDLMDDDLDWLPCVPRRDVIANDP